MALTAITLNCSLKRSGGEPSSTDRLLGEIAAAMKSEGVETVETIRIADHDVKPGVTSDEGEGDAWPALRARILAADILVVGGPVWMGQPGSVVKRVLERMDAFFDEKDDKGRTPAFGKIACVAVVGNEDGAHHVSAELFQALNDVGYTLAPFAVTYWVGEAMGAVNYVDLKEAPKAVAETTAMLAHTAAHLAGLLKGRTYPGIETGD